MNPSVLRGLSLALSSFFLSTLLSFSALASNLDFPFIPDTRQTNGSVCSPSDPDFVEYRYDERIPYCARKVSTRLKADIYDAYGVPAKCRKGYTIDHFLPLSLGGTNHRDNLWPESKQIKATRQNLEMDLYNRLAKGEITQARALQIVKDTKWNPSIKDPSAFDFCH